MTQRFEFYDESSFLKKLRELIAEGVPKENITTFSPYPVHGVDELLDAKPSGVRPIGLMGALTGLIVGFAFTIYTVLNWPLFPGGKPLISIPAFLIIAFALTILLGSLAAFTGFIVLAKLPGIGRIISEEDCTNRFEIEVKGGE